MSRPSATKPTAPEFFYSTICHTCKETCDTRNSLKRCGGCKMISYCSVSHQKRHWSKHKPLCACIRAMVRTSGCETLFDEASELTDSKQWADIRVSKMVLCEISIGRKLAAEEEHMFLFPRVCAVCKSANQNSLTDCPSCHVVSYCSREHRELDTANHSIQCAMLKLCLSLDVYFHMGNQLPYVNFPVQDAHRSLPTSMNDFISYYIKESQIGPLIYDDDPKTYALLSEYLTCSLTILYALEKINCGNSKQLTLHLVGATAFESSLLKRWEALLHWLPHVKHCCLVFVGPNLEESVEDDYSALCSECEASGKKMKHLYYSTVYHDYVRSQEFKEPDLVVSFNCGIHEYEGSESDTWSLTIPFLFKSKSSHLLITAYAKDEAEKDVEIVKKHCPNSSAVVHAENNPFASQRPYRDWASEDTPGVFFQNNYLSIIKKD